MNVSFIIHKFIGILITLAVLTVVKPVPFFPISLGTNAYGNAPYAPRSITVVKQVIERHLTGLQTEYELILYRNPDLGKGNVTVKFLIEPTGEVPDCAVIKTTFDNKPFERDIEKRIERWEFSQVDGGQCAVIITFVFCEKNGSLPGTAIVDDIDCRRIVRAYEVDGVHTMELENIRIEPRPGMIITSEVIRREMNKDAFTSRLEEYYGQEVYRELSGAEPVRPYLKYKEIEKEIRALSEKRDKEIERLIEKRGNTLKKTREMELTFEVEEMGASAELTDKLELPSTRGYDDLCRKLKTYDVDINEVKREYGNELSKKERTLSEARLGVTTSCETVLSDGSIEPELTYLSNYILGELYVAAAEEEYKSAYEKWLESLEETPADERKPEPIPDYSEAIAIFETAINEYTDGPLNDVILYNLGYCQYSQGDTVECAETLYNLASLFPDSELTPEAYFRLGDDRFYTNKLDDYEEAIRYYEKVPPYSDLYDEALYKTAWAYYNIARYNDTELEYENVIGKSVELIERAAKGTELYDEGIDLIAVSIVGLTDSDEEESAAYNALKTFETLFEGVNRQPYSAEVLHRLADVYQYDHDRLDTAIILYEALFAKYPLYERASEVLSSCVTPYLHKEDHEGGHNVRTRIVDYYGPVSEWFNTYDDLDFKVTAFKNWEKALYEVAVYNHYMGEQEQDKSKNKAFYKEAIKRYTQYLETFPTNRKSYHLNFYLAMAYAEAGEWELAYDNYLKTALGYEDRERYEVDKWSQRFTKADSLLNGIILLYELSMDFKAEKGADESLYKSALPTNDIPERPPEKPPVKEPSPIEGRMIYSCDLFLTEYPDAPETPVVLNYLGETYLSLSDYTEARSYFKKVVDDYASKPGNLYGYPSNEYNEYYIGNLVKIGDCYHCEALYFEGLGDVYYSNGSEYAAEAYRKSLGLYEEAKNVYEAAYELSSGFGFTDLTEEALESKNGCGVKISELEIKIGSLHD
jgi:tetratricopeptide (TPR) repeat protein